jgi:Glycosyltransferase family 87
VRLGEAARRLAPAIAVALLALSTGAVLLSAGATLGYDYQAYAHAAQRLLDGRPLYDPNVDVAGGFAIYLYPPPFAVAVVPFTLLPGSLGTWAWLGALVAAFLAGTALLPVRLGVRWTIVLLATMSLPFLYSVKLGQVGPLLYLFFAIGWRSLDRPLPLGLAVAAGALTKVQPALLFAWMVLTKRWRAVLVGLVACGAAALVATVVTGLATWADYAALLGRVNQPVTTPKNMTPGAIAWRAGASLEIAIALEWAAAAATLVIALFAWLRRDPATGFVVSVVASQILSPLLWDHYAMLLLLPVALLLQRRQWWAAGIPLVTWLPIDALYPLAFAVGLLGPIRTSSPAIRSADQSRGRSMTTQPPVLSSRP